MKNRIAILILVLILCFNCNIKTNMKTYQVKKTNSIYKMQLIEENDKNWKEATPLSDFSYPWRNELPEETIFKALYDDNYLFLKYEVKDSNILISNVHNSKMDVAQSDRVEIFFRKDETLKEYYCLEIDPKGKVLDYKASYYRKFDENWSWPKGHLFVTGENIKGGYKVEVSISLKSLKDLGLLKNDEIESGIYRGNCIELPSKENIDGKIKWISWINPMTDMPDFHVPNSFGILKLENF